MAKEVSSEERIFRILKNSSGLTITDLVNHSGLSRSAVRIALARMEGSGNVDVKRIGMAKVYSVKKKKSKK